MPTATQSNKPNPLIPVPLDDIRTINALLSTLGAENWLPIHHDSQMQNRIELTLSRIENILTRVVDTEISKKLGEIQ